jgi:hypothetical protein
MNGVAAGTPQADIDAVVDGACLTVFLAWRPRRNYMHYSEGAAWQQAELPAYSVICACSTPHQRIAEETVTGSIMPSAYPICLTHPHKTATPAQQPAVANHFQSLKCWRPCSTADLERRTGGKFHVQPNGHRYSFYGAPSSYALRMRR